MEAFLLATIAKQIAPVHQKSFPHYTQHLLFRGSTTLFLSRSDGRDILGSCIYVAQPSGTSGINVTAQSVPANQLAEKWSTSL